VSSALPEEARRRLLDDARRPPSPEECATGELVYGRYRVVRELGRGGMGVVYEAEDVSLRRRVALKVLALPAGLGPSLSEEVLREARAAARLNHPNIAAVYDAHAGPGGGAIAMQLVQGGALSTLARADARRLVALVRDAALAVHHAHEQGIVHRDLKPHNLLVEGERVLVTDFGLAKELALESSLSLSGSVLGTPAYMPPEQAGGRAREVDARSDVYALGATLYDLLAGRPPFVERDVVRVLTMVVQEEPPPLARLAPAVPRDLARVVHKALEKEKARRFASARELADDLTRWLDGRPVLARAPSLGYRAHKFARRNRAWLGAASLAALALLAALGLTWSERAERRATEEALALSGIVQEARRDAALLEPREREAALARLDQGIARCRAFLERHDVAQGHFLLGRLLRARGKPAEALAALERALALDPGLAPARLERGLLRAAQVFAARAGREAEAEGDELAREREAARLDLAVVDSGAGDLGLIDLALGRAQLARLEGDPERAERGFRAVLDYDDLYAEKEAQLALAELELERGDPEAARARAMSAIDLALGRGAAYVGPAAEGEGEAVARAVRQMERDAELAEHDRAVAARPFDPAPRAARGFQRLAAGELVEGRADLETALYLGAAGELAARIEAALAKGTGGELR